LALAGNYDWFYEGFTVYHALKTGVKMNQIRFEDFLDTLVQAYNLDNLQTQKISLVEASKSRRSGAGNAQVYARGMIVAFLCDVALLRQSHGKKSISDVFEKIYRLYHSPNKRQDGNTAILKTLNDYGELNFVIEKYIKGIEKIDWQADLASAGIEASEENSFTRLKIKAKPSGRQKDLLDRLGYNNWRKVSGKAK
jgi:predicted metalloprotease with PDZ domain